MTMFITITDLSVIVSEFSSIISAVIIQILLWGMILYFIKHAVFIWFSREQILLEETNSTISERTPQLKMIRVNLPFTFKLQDNPEVTFREISCKVSSQVSYRFFAYWGVSISDLHMFLWQPWVVISPEVMNGNLLEGHYQNASISYSCRMHTERVIKVKKPHVPLNFGDAPRNRYPLVVLMFIDIPSSSKPDDTVGIINVIHVKDRDCQLPTSTLVQYMKQANGFVYTLKHLYVTSSVSDPESSEENIGTAEYPCVICNYYPITRVLLPCRHGCVCGICFNKIETCPLCRSTIKEYFSLRDEDCCLDNKINSPSSPAQLFNSWYNNYFGSPQ